MQIKIIREASLRSFEKSCNDFISNISPKDIKDIKFVVQRDFLPHTTAGETIEIYYGMIFYAGGNNEKSNNL